MNTIILVLLEESVEDSVVFDFYGYSTFPIKHGRQHHQELKTWGSATPGTPSARSALLAEDHMRCGGIWPEILGQLQLHFEAVALGFGNHCGRYPRREDTPER
jgi:hypothetical protein